jgi:adenine-specific DNA-methyltransferase
LEEVAAQIKGTLGPDALNAEGNLAEAYQGTPLGKKHLSLKAKAEGARSRGALANAVYNHLYAFFSRYYQDGDFISKRRYSKRERYAIPYNGEEVYLYWANHDQFTHGQARRTLPFGLFNARGKSSLLVLFQR